MSLNPKQTRFVEEYLIDLNATQAAIRAGYSAKTAEQQGAVLLRNPPIRTAVDHALALRSQKSGLTAEWVIDQLRENVSLAKEAGQYAAATKALELLGKHLGILVDRTDVTVRHVDQLEAADIERELAELDAAERAGKRSGARNGDAIH